MPRLVGWCLLLPMQGGAQFPFWPPQMKIYFSSFHPGKCWFPPALLSRKLTISSCSWTQFCPVAVVCLGCVPWSCSSYAYLDCCHQHHWLMLKFAFLCGLPFPTMIVLKFVTPCLFCVHLAGSYGIASQFETHWQCYLNVLLFINDDFNCFCCFQRTVDWSIQNLIHEICKSTWRNGSQFFMLTYSLRLKIHLPPSLSTTRNVYNI